MPFDVLNVDQMFREIVATHLSQEMYRLQNVLISIITHHLCALKQVNMVRSLNTRFMIFLFKLMFSKATKYDETFKL